MSAITKFGMGDASTFGGRSPELVDRKEPTGGDIDDKVAAMQSAMDAGEFSCEVQEDFVAGALVDLVIHAIGCNKRGAELNALADRLMLRMMSIPSFRDRAKKELLGG